MQQAELIGSSEAARILGVDRSGVIRRVQAGKLTPTQRLGGATGAHLFERAEVEALADAEQPADPASNVTPLRRARSA